MTHNEANSTDLLDAAKAAFTEGWLAGRASDPTPMTKEKRIEEAESDWRGSDAERLASDAPAYLPAVAGQCALCDDTGWVDSFDAAPSPVPCRCNRDPVGRAFPKPNAHLSGGTPSAPSDC